MRIFKTKKYTWHIQLLRKPNHSPKAWTRKGECPSCNVSTGSRHGKSCTFDYRATK